MPNFKFSGHADCEVTIRIYKESSKEYIAYIHVQPGNYTAVYELDERENVLVVGESLNGGIIGYNYISSEATTDAVNTIPVNSRIEQRIYYDSIVDPKLSSNISSTALVKRNQRFAGKVVNNFNAYSKSKWCIEDTTNCICRDGITFNSLNDLVSYKNTYYSEHPSEVSIKPYDSIDPKIPVVDKVYGVNRLFYALKGSLKYKDGEPHCGNVHTSFTKAGEIMWDMWDTQFGSSFSSLVTPTDFLSGNGKYAIWLPSDEKKMHGIPRDGSRIVLTGGNGRYYGCENWEDFQPVNVAGSKIYTISNPRVLTWTGIKTNDGEISIYNPTKFKDRRLIRGDILTSSTSTGLIFFRVYDAETVGERSMSIYVKPFTIDTLYINYVNLDLYDIECVYENYNTQKNYFRVVNPLDIDRSNKRIDHMIIPKKYWLPNNGITTRWNAGGYIKPPSVRFRLRNKTTGYIGALSNAKLVAKISERIVPIKWVIE